MNTPTVRLALVIVALVLGVVDVVRSRATSLTAWAVVALSVALAAAWWDV